MKKACLYIAIVCVCIYLIPIVAIYSSEGDKIMELKQSKYPTKAILDNVPRIGYDSHLCPFPGSLYAYLEYVKEPNDYDYIMGVTGAAFRRIWNKDDGGNVDLSYLGETPFKHIFDALGYEYQTIPTEKEAMINAIKESINKGRPVISFGIIGPPEAGLVTGYDQDGKVLYGWSYFQEGKDKYYEKSDWFETMDKNAGKGLIVIGDKIPRPSDREIFIVALKWAIDLERTAKRPNLPNHICGLPAYEAWASGLEADSDYPKDDPKILETRAMVHGDQCAMLDERFSAANFLRSMTKIAPEALKQLESAAKLYDEIASQGQYLWHWGSPMDPETGKALADPDTRKEMAKHIRIAGEKEAQAVEYLEKVLAILTKEKEERVIDKDATNAQ